uniref:Erythromycin biosynthesis protein CIII-like C-terminal domain-containing protein n=1 Tax=Oryza meridionalis TaxID=40149 RepID=A0A0E0CHJ2_9ORYZ
MDGGGGGRRPRAVFMAFGTRGDVFPIAALAAAFAQDQRQYSVVFITHSAHQSLSTHLADCNVRYMPVSSPPVLAAEQLKSISCDSVQSNAEHDSFSQRKKIIQVEHRKECLSAVENVFGNDMSTHGDFIVINFFALEGWHLAELFQVKCIIAAPYFVPYSAPASFERQFKQSLPLLYKYFQEAPLNMDPVTNLPLWYMREESPLLLYGFSKEIVECPVAESSEYQASALHCDSNILFNGRLFCFSGWLFPKCAIAIHHAGSGSTAAALFAGIPQISCPFLLDQFYWAERLHWLGVAPEPLRRQHLILDTDNASSINNAADMLIGAIKSALSPEIKAQATRIANKLSSEDGIGEALRILKERVLPQSES